MVLRLVEVFDIKIDNEGKVVKRKVRFCLDGSRQVQGVHFDESYAPVVSMDTIRMVLSLTAQLDLELNQMDVVSAYTYADEPSELYCNQAMGDKEGDSMVKCKLLKNLYGAKPSGRHWYLLAEEVILKFRNMKQSLVDKCLFYSEESVVFL